MEMFELKYFGAVAETENIHAASAKLNISPSAVSKAISRLEDELKVALFEKSGRNIKLTEQGRKLFQQSKKFTELENETKLLVSDNNSPVEIRIAGPEVFLAYYGLQLTREIKKKYAQASFVFLEMSEQEAEVAVQDRRVHFAFLTYARKSNSKLNYRTIESVFFATYVGKKHALANKKRPIPVDELLTYDFLVPGEDIFGGLKSKASTDGWRDDKFERKIKYKNLGLKTLELLLDDGHAIAYLPPYFADSLDFKKLTIIGCPYVCEQTVTLVSGNAWSNQEFFERIKKVRDVIV